MQRASPHPENGFTLLEALAALAVLAAIMGALAAVAGQWLPQWRHGFEAVQNADVVAQSLDRVVADLSGTVFVRLDPRMGPPLFRGDADAVIFVRAASGPGATPRLDYVRIGAAETPEGRETQRSRTAFKPGPLGPFRDAATVLRPPFRLSFAYLTPDGHWLTSWNAQPSLPVAVQLMVKNGSALVAATAFQLRTTTPVDAFATSDAGNAPPPDPNSPSNASPPQDPNPQ